MIECDQHNSRTQQLGNQSILFGSIEVSHENLAIEKITTFNPSCMCSVVTIE